MKTNLRKTASMLLVTLMAVSSVSYAYGNEKIIMRENFTGAVANEKWNGSDTGRITDANSGKYYISTENGYNQLAAPSLTVTDAQIEAKISVDSWSDAADAFVGLALRTNGKAGYRAAYYPAEKNLRIEQTDENGTVTDIIDQYGMELAAGKEYSFNFSAKDYMLRADIDGAVILMGADYINGNIASGGAAVVTNNQYAKFTVPVVKGEDRLVYNNFDAGRDFSQATALNRYGNNGDTNHRVLRTNAGGTFSYQDGMLKYYRSQTFANLIGTYAADYELTDETAAAWKHTKLSAKLKNSGGNFVAATHATLFEQKAYVQLIPSTTSGSIFYKQKNSGTRITDVTHSKSFSIVNNTPFDYDIETQTNDENVTLKYYFNGELATTVIDSSRHSTFGGFFFNCENKSQSLYIDDLIFRDMNAAVKDTDILYAGNSFEDWESVGDAVGETGVGEGEGRVYRVASEENGILLLKDKSWKNVSVSADVDTVIGTDAYVAIYARYFDENNNVRLMYDGEKLSVVAKKYGTDTVLAEDAYSAESPFRMELQAYEGFYRGYINGKLVTLNTVAADKMGIEYTTPDTLTPRTLGTVGLQAYGCSADFDNVTVGEEKRLVHLSAPKSDSSDAKRLIYNNPYDNGAVVYSTDIMVPDKSVGNILFNLKSRMIHQDCYFWVQLVEKYSSNDPVIRVSYNNGNIVDKDIAAKLNYGKINNITIRQATEKTDNEEQPYQEVITVSLNGEAVVERYTLDRNAGIVGTNQSSVQVLYAGNHINLGGTAAILDTEGYFEEAGASEMLLFDKTSLSEGSMEAGLTVENTTDSIAILDPKTVVSALYDENGILRQMKRYEIKDNVQINPGEARSFIADSITIPAKPYGWKLKAFCWNSLGEMKPLSIAPAEMTCPIPSEQ